MDDKLRPVREWVRARAHSDLDSSSEQIVAAAVERFALDEAEALALCEAEEVQYWRVRYGMRSS